MAVRVLLSRLGFTCLPRHNQRRWLIGIILLLFLILSYAQFDYLFQITSFYKLKTSGAILRRNVRVLWPDGTPEPHYKDFYTTSRPIPLLPHSSDSLRTTTGMPQDSGHDKPAQLSRSNTTREKKGGKEKLIVWYNERFRKSNKFRRYSSICGNYSCQFSNNPKDVQRADGVIINAFYLKPHDKPPERSDPNQIWVFYTREPETNIRYVKWPSKHWKTLFNWTLTFRTDSDIPFPYGAIVKRNLSKKNWLEVAKSKNRSAAWFVGHCHTIGRREDYVTALQGHGVQIDIYGKCGKLKLQREMEKECYNNHRFYIAFESVFCEDYITEKLFKVMEHDVVPIVRAGRYNSNSFPVGSFINTADFKTPKDLAKYLLYLDKNVTAYAEVLKKKSQFRTTNPQPWCEVCRRLHELPSYRKTYPDIDQWLDMKKCYLPTDL